MFLDYYSSINSQAFSGGTKRIFVLNIDGCGGCTKAIVNALEKHKCIEGYEVVFIAKFKKEVSQYVEMLGGYHLMYDNDGGFYKNLTEPMRSLHYFVIVSPNGVENQPITPQNLEEFILKIRGCS